MSWDAWLVAREHAAKPRPKWPWLIAGLFLSVLIGGHQNHDAGPSNVPKAPVTTGQTTDGPKMLDARGAGVLPIFRDNDAMNRAFDLHRAGITDDSL